MNTVTHLTPQELDLLRPLAEARAAAIAAENYKTRSILAAALAALDAEEAEAMPPLEAAAAAALEAFESASAAYSAALADAEMAGAAATRCRLAFDAQKARLHRELNLIAPPAIPELEEQLREGERLTRDGFYLRQQATGELELVEGRHLPRMATYTNADEIQARVSVIRAALAECEAMRLQATPPDELASRLADIRRKALGHLQPA